MFDHELKALESKESAFLLFGSFIFKTEKISHLLMTGWILTNIHRWCFQGKPGFWKDVYRTLHPALHLSVIAFVMDKMVWDWNTDQGHPLRWHYFEERWLLKLTGSLNQHLTHNTPRMRKAASNGSLKNLHSDAPIALLGRMIVYAVHLIQYKNQGIITASLLLL